jgi:hypothetical protein
MNLTWEEEEAFRQFPIWSNCLNCSKAKNMLLNLSSMVLKEGKELAGLLTDDEALFIAGVFREYQWINGDIKQFLLSKINDSSEGKKPGIDIDKLCRKLRTLSSFSCFAIVALGEEMFKRINAQLSCPAFDLVSL